MAGAPQESLLWSEKPSILVVVTDQPFRQLIVELLERYRACWHVQSVANQIDLAAALAIKEPHLVVLDTGDFARFCRETAHAVAPHRVVVIGPEPDAGYERAALRAGAAAWLSRDRVREDLTTCMGVALGCTGEPTPHGPPPLLTACRYMPNGAA